MENRIYDEKNGLWYEKQGDYYLPCLELPEQETKPVGIWGQRHLRYIKEHKRTLYANLLTSCKLNSYLADIDEQAERYVFSAGKRICRQAGSNRTAKGRKSNAVGTAYEQYP